MGMVRTRAALPRTRATTDSPPCPPTGAGSSSTATACGRTRSRSTHPDWSPDGKTIAFTSHLVTDVSDNHVTAELYVINADGGGTPTRLTSNAEEERSPNWSPDGARILFACRRGAPAPRGPFPTFELCV